MAISPRSGERCRKKRMPAAIVSPLPEPAGPFDSTWGPLDGPIPRRDDPPTILVVGKSWSSLADRRRPSRGEGIAPHGNGGDPPPGDWKGGTRRSVDTR